MPIEKISENISSFWNDIFTENPYFLPFKLKIYNQIFLCRNTKYFLNEKYQNINKGLNIH